MAIRNWSFTRLCGAVGIVWCVAWVLRGVLDYFDISGLVPFLIASVPAFLAGSWAGSHAEIATWPRVRLVALWVFAAGIFLGISDWIGAWRALAVVIAAPPAVLTLRWYELTHGAPRLASDQEAVITPAPPPPPPRLPRG